MLKIKVILWMLCAKILVWNISQDGSWIHLCQVQLESEFYTVSHISSLQNLLCRSSALLNAITACQEISSIFSTFLVGYHNFVIISENHPYFHVTKKRKCYWCKLADWILPYRKLWFPVLILKYLNPKTCAANFVQNCKIYPKEVLINKIKGIINFGKFSRSYDDLYLGFTFGGGDTVYTFIYYRQSYFGTDC